jgi:hypothetical protein
MATADSNSLLRRGNWDGHLTALLRWWERKKETYQMQHHGNAAAHTHAQHPLGGMAQHEWHMSVSHCVCVCVRAHIGRREGRKGDVNNKRVSGHSNPCPTASEIKQTR